MDIIFNVLPPTFVVLGSIGMLGFASKFPFSTALRDLKYVKERFLFLNGYYLWNLSWGFIIAGSIIQFWDAVSRLCQQ